MKPGAFRLPPSSSQRYFKAQPRWYAMTTLGWLLPAKGRNFSSRPEKLANDEVELMIIANLAHHRFKALLVLSGLAFALQAQGQSLPESDPAPEPPPVAIAQPEAQTKQLTNFVETGGD